jgi:hypothetical protein
MVPSLLTASDPIGREIRYFTFGDHNFQAQLESMYEILCLQKVTVGKSEQLLSILTVKAN